MTSNQNNEESFAQAKIFIENHSKFVLLSHARTDGDDLGSILALTETLKSYGKTGIPVAVGGVPPSLKFLHGQNNVLDHFPEGEFDAIILSGCGDINRTGIPDLEKKGLPILNIDHHPDNKKYGAVNVVDATKSSVAELVYDFIKFLGTPITQEIAKSLLTGIFTDTGSFMHSNTTESTLKAAGEMVGIGARTDKIYSFTYNKDISSLKAWALAMENTKIDEENKLVFSILTEEDIQKIRELPDDAFTGFINFLQSVPECRVSMFMYQDGEYIKGSLRSEEDKNFNVSKLAKFFGGGGHKLASGFRVKGKVIKTENGWRIE